MKNIVRIFNIVIMALSALATIFIFTMPTISFNSKITFDINTFSQFVPSTPYTDDLDLVTMLGTDEVQAGIKFTMKIGDTSKILNKDKKFVNEDIIGPNVDGIFEIIRDPVVLITEYSVRSFLKGIIKDEITAQIENARQKYGDTGSTTEDIMDEVGINDEYLDNFTFALYREADKEGATIDSLTEVLYNQVDDALAKAEESGAVDTSSYTEASRASLSDYLINNLTDMSLVNEDNSLNRISQMSFLYLSNYLVDALTGQAEASELVKMSDEDDFAFSERLLRLFIYYQIPEDVYNVLSYVGLALLIGVLVFSINWIVLLLFTLLRTVLGKKPWTIFGPWFWTLGSLQIALGIALTWLGKITLPSLDIATYLAAYHIPLKSIILAPRTFTLVPSIIYIICIPLSIVYGFFKRGAKRQINREEEKA